MQRYFIALVLLVLSTTQVFASMKSPRAFKCEKSQLQHVFFRHKKDFGMDKKWNKDTHKEFEQTLYNHVQNPQTIKIPGTYRGVQPVVHYFASTTSVNVMTSPKGSLISGWKLNDKQAECVEKVGKL